MDEDTTMDSDQEKDAMPTTPAADANDEDETSTDDGAAGNMMASDTKPEEGSDNDGEETGN